MGTNPRQISRERRQARVRKRVLGTAVRPRLCVFRSAVHIYAQIIDDSKGITLVEASTLSLHMKAKPNYQELTKTAQALEVGKSLAALAKEKGIDEVVFDRNGFLYHGRVKALSDGAREAGLKF